MPEADKEGERYAVDQPQQTPGFFLKGTHQLDWGMKNRMARVFDRVSGRAVMLAIDHGYFQAPTTGLVRIQVFMRRASEPRSIQKLTQLADPGLRMCMPVMAITPVGEAMLRDATY